MGLFRYFVLDPLQSDAAFRQGFVTALVVATSLFLVSRPVLKLWNKVVGFFKPTKEMMTKDGPSHYHRLTGCAGAGLGLAAVLTLVFVMALFTF